MPVLLALIIRTIIQFGITLGLWELLDRYVVPLYNQMIAEIVQLFGVSEQDAQDMAANEILQTVESFAGGVALLRSKLPTTIAEKFGFTSKGFNRRILKSEVQTRVPSSGSVVQAVALESPQAQATMIETISQKRGVSLSLVKSFFNGSIKVLNTTFLGFLVAANVLDFGNWNSGAYQHQVQRLFAWFGLEPDKEFPKSSVLSSDMWQKISATYKQLGAVGIDDPFKRASMLYNQQNLVDLIDKVAATIIAEKGKVTFQDVFLASQAFIVMGGPVTDAKLDKIYGVATAQAAGVPSTPYTQINIENLPFGQIIVPPLVVERITNAEELKDAIKSTIAQFANQIPNRLSFEIQLVRFWVDPQGQMITPNPPVYIERVKTSMGESTKTVQNKIVVLSVYFTTHEAKRVKIYAWPLDYSVADSIITSAPEGSTNPIPITIDVVKQIISQPSVVTTPQTPISATPATVVAPSAQIPGTGIQSSPAQPQTSVLTAVNYTSNDPYTRKLQALEQSRTLADLISVLGFSIPAGYTQDDQNGVLFGFIKNQASGGGIASITPQFIADLFNRYGKKETDKIDKRIFPLTVTVLSDVLLVRAAPNTASSLAGSQRLLKGMQFIAVDAVIGENVNGQPWWWKSQVGNYVWSGGTDEGR